MDAQECSLLERMVEVYLEQNRPEDALEILHEQARRIQRKIAEVVPMIAAKVAP